MRIIYAGDFAPPRLCSTTARVLGSVSNNQSTCSWHLQRENWVSSLFLPLIGAKAAAVAAMDPLSLIHQDLLLEAS